MRLHNRARSGFSIGLLLASCLFALHQIGAAQGRIAFTSDRDGNVEIYSMAANGSNQTRLTNEAALDSSPSFSFDGTKILFHSLRMSPHETAIFSMNSNGSNQVPLTSTTGAPKRAHMSPDGTKIVYLAFVPLSGNYVFVMDADGSNITQLTNTPGTPGNSGGPGDNEPHFSFDGAKIVFSSNRDGNNEIYVMDADGTDQTRLTTNAASDDSPSFGPDGRIVFHSNRDGNEEIYIMNADGTGQTRLTNNSASDAQASVSPYGNKIGFASDRDGNYEIYVMDLNGANQTRITNNPATDFNLSWGPDPEPCSVPAEGMMAWYRLENNANDSAGPTFENGDPDGLFVFEPGKVGQSYNSFTTNQYMDLGNWFDLQTFTIEMWVKAEDVQLAAHADIIDNNHTDFQNWVIQYDNVGTQYHYGAAGDSNVITFNLTPGTFQHIVVTRDASRVTRLYLDNVLIGSATSSGDLPYNNPSLRLGAWAAGGRHFNGLIDETSIYDRALSASEILSIYNAGSAGKCVAPPPLRENGRIAFHSNRDGDSEIYTIEPDGTALAKLTNNAAVDAQPSFNFDGNKITFVSRRDGGLSEIYVMGSDGTNPTRLTVTGGEESDPAFSPDGNKIIFASKPDGELDNEIFTINAFDGSGLQRLTTNDSDDLAPSFSPNGSTIVFVSDNIVTLMDANGTNPTTLHSGMHPSFSPDGSKVLFSPGDGIYTINTDGSGIAQLYLSGDFPVYSPDGTKVAFRTGNPDIYVLALDTLQAINTTNDPSLDTHPSWGPLSTEHGNSPPLITPSSVSITEGETENLPVATVSDTEDTEETLTVTLDGAATVNGITISNFAVDSSGAVTADITAVPGAGDANFTLVVTDSNLFSNEALLEVSVVRVPLDLSGERVAFHSIRDGNFEIYVMNSDGTGQTRLTEHSASDSQPAFSANGTKIAFVSDRDGSEQIYVMDASGTDLTRVTHDSTAIDVHPAFSPDGNKIVFESARNGNVDIYLIPSFGLNPIRLTNDPANDYQPVFSPDGTKIVFISDRTGSRELYIMDANGSGQQRVSTLAARDPSFSPDGTKVLFADFAGSQMFTVNIDGTDLQPTPFSVSGTAPVFSTDGSKIAFRTNDQEIGLINFDGSGAAANLTNNAASDGGPSWGPWNTVTPPSDNTPPTIVPQITGTLGSNGWYIGDVGISWAVADDESAIGSQNGCEAQNVTADTGGVTYTCSATSEGGTTSDSVTIKRDATAPSISLQSRTPANGNGWNNTDVSLVWNCSDALSGVVNSTDSQTVSAEGQDQSASGDCQDNAGNTASDTQDGISIDKTAPILNPAVNPNPVTLGGIAVASPGASDALSGIASQSCGTPDTSTAGSKSVSCTAADMAGNTASGNAAYMVNGLSYNFSGFLQPVDNWPVVNEVNAGRSIPVKFSLSGFQGMNIFAPGYPASAVTTCGSSDPTDIIEETVNAGGSSLTYDAATDRYNYVWKTEKSWKGQCRILIVRLNDGNSYVASFRFK